MEWLHIMNHESLWSSLALSVATSLSPAVQAQV